jgi:transcriptional regulator with XRE-family HTH domain
MPMRRKYPAPVEEKTIGHRLMELRKRRGLTQAVLAERLGMTQPLLSRYERGELRLHGALIAAFAKVLKTKPEKILGLEDLEETGYITDRRFARRLQRIDKLPKRDKELLLGTIDAFLSKVS